jgi:hypothetical protein
MAATVTTAEILQTEMLQDDLATSLARALAVANRRAYQAGIDILQSIITITQRFFRGDLLWQINYGPKDYVGRRGGDFIVEVDPSDGSIKQILRGQ